MTSEINFTNSTLNTKNITVSGQTQFSNLPTCSVVPTIGEEFVNKGYVDSLVGQYSGGYNMFFNYSVTDGSYKQLGNTIVDVSQNQIDITTTDSTRQLVEQFVSSALNITTIPVGIWNVLLYGTVSSAAANVRYTCDIHTLDGVTLSAVLATSSQSEDINAVTTPAAYTMNITLATAITCLLTTKLVVRLFVQNVGSTVPLTVSTYFQNMYYSYIQTSLNEGTTLLTSNNNWTGSNTFPAITPSSSITYNASTGTPIGTIGYTYVGTYTGGTGGAGNADWTLGTLTLPIGLFFVSANISWRIQGTPTTGTGHITTFITDGTTKYGYSRIPSPAPLVDTYATNVNAVICITTASTVISAVANLKWTSGLMNKIGTEFRFTATRIA